MLDKFLHIISRYPDYQKKKYLIAVSGGLDSMVLLDLMYRSKLNFYVAHCNFKLRGTDSDADEKLVKSTCKKLNIPYFIKKCPVTPGKNIQLEARKLRYEWFEKLMKENKLDFLLTAHHADDNLETFFINLLRKSGLGGLTGIPETDRMKRPLLSFFREELKKYALERNITWREDASNYQDKYLRNAIRLKVIPLLENIKPRAKANILDAIKLLQQSLRLEDDWFESLKMEIIEENHPEQILNTEKLHQQKHADLFLFKWLHPYGFRNVHEIKKLISAQTGRKMENDNWQLIKYQNKLILTPVTPKTNKKFVFQKMPDEIKEPVHLIFSRLNKNQIPENFKNTPTRIVYLDAQKLQTPLRIETWKPGERMQPIGMKHFKKISDILTDLKIPLHEKQKSYVLYSRETPVWLIGKKLDDRFKITPDTEQVIRIELLSEN